MQRTREAQTRTRRLGGYNGSGGVDFGQDIGERDVGFTTKEATTVAKAGGTTDSCAYYVFLLDIFEEHAFE